MQAIIPLAKILVFPGFLFLAVYGLLLQWVDRKLCAVMQNRMGPPWFQPLADFIKLLAKEVIVPDEASSFMFRTLPFFAMAAVMTALVSIPVLGPTALYGFQGDLVAVIYLLTIPT
ncbi:MAG: NADH-quinone oxidoreductase subunit H, partial [Elusimicrobia bacterium]|nr:NADH-quinone oxidoreductase subunit H [Elusimicrobiota bacterium]